MSEKGEVVNQKVVQPCPANKRCMIDCKLCKTGEEINERVSANYAAGIIPEHIRNGFHPIDVTRI